LRSPAKGAGRQRRGRGTVWWPHLAPAGGEEATRWRGVAAAGAWRWGCAREAGRGRGGAGEGWMVRGSLGSYYRLWGGYWRGGRREEGVPSTAVVQELMGRRGREPTRRTFPREGRGIGDASSRLLSAQEQHGRESRRGTVAATSRWRCSASIPKKEKGRVGRLGQMAAWAG
jgi:hypothetical protein